MQSILSKAQMKIRNREIVELLRERNPDGTFSFTYQDIAATYRITRERVRQIGRMGGSANRAAVLKQLNQEIKDSAPECAIEHCSERVKVLGSSRFYYAANGRCKNHGRDVVLITCAQCGKKSERERYHVHVSHRSNRLRSKPQERWFCDNKCQGKFIGREYGFIAHPENSNGGKSGSGPMSGVTLADLKALADAEE